MKVHITGIGVVSAIGIGVKETLESLKAKKTGISKKTFAEINADFYTGIVDRSNEALAKIASCKDVNMSRTSLLGIIAAQECWAKNKKFADIRTGIISGTSVGGMDRSEVYFQEKHTKGQSDFQKLIYHDSGNTTEKIADHLGITGYINTISTACSSASNAILLGARLLRAGKLDRVLVGGSDAMTAFTLSGFNSLMVFSDEWCQPFDEKRKGLNLGEGAGYLLLENDRSLAKTGNKTLGVVSGWKNTADAYHQTATSPNADGATMAMKGALDIAGITPEQIDYINAHGTSTQNNDVTESIALKNIFGDMVPPFSSTKAYTGHTLAASGGIEAVFSVFSMQENLLLPNLNFQDKIEETQLTPITEVIEDVEVNHVVSNSFGFGGNCTSLVFSKQ